MTTSLKVVGGNRLGWGPEGNEAQLPQGVDLVQLSTSDSDEGAGIDVPCELVNPKPGIGPMLLGEQEVHPGNRREWKLKRPLEKHHAKRWSRGLDHDGQFERVSHSAASNRPSVPVHKLAGVAQ